MLKSIPLFILSFIFLVTCDQKTEDGTSVITLNQIAENYVKLSLEIGLYDQDYIDAYYGPDDWRMEKSEEKEFPYEEIKWKTTHLLHQLEDINRSEFEPIEEMRIKFLYKLLIAAKTKVEMIVGGRISFDEESRALYDAVAPDYDVEYFDKILNELDKVLPGKGDISKRYSEFSKQFIIPIDKLDTVFKTAIEEAKRRTLQHLDLPENENFTIEYVTGKSWSAYNWYKGNSYSLIQINTDLPIHIERAIDLASHEGYPGHHVYNVMLEKNLVKDRGWVEFMVYPLFSPQSLIAEGSANFGIEMVFPGDDRLKFEKEVLFPLAGLDSSLAEIYSEVQYLKSPLNYAGNEAARDYLNGNISKDEAVAWLTKYSLFTNERAIQRVKFIDKYRSYVINYNWGKDLVSNYIKNLGGTMENPEKRWEIFKEIISTPITASSLAISSD